MATSGRRVRIKYDADGAGGSGAVVIAGARTDGVTINNTSIDITDKDDAGIMTLLDDVAVQSFAMSCEGLLVWTQLEELAANTKTAGSALNYFVFEVLDQSGSIIVTYSGNFFIDSFEIGASHEDVTTFTAAFTSSGTITRATS